MDKTRKDYSMKYATKEEACRAWVKEFNAIPQGMAFQGDCPFEDWDFFGKTYDDDAEEEYGSVDVPMWGWVWMVDDYCDEQWIRDNMETVADCGFTIMENCEEGWLLLGIDGAGYDFYEAHWLPLYEARGFRWHKED